MKTTLVLIAAAGLASAATPALAESPASSITVSYADLNLETPEGQDRLNRRIDYAARAVCGYDRFVAGQRVIGSEVRKCMDKAAASAKARVATLVEDAARGG